MPQAILITRPEPGGARFAAQLRDAAPNPDDLQICLSPVMRIVAEAADVPLDGVRGLVFTSQYGVEQFAARVQGRGLPVFAVGRATGEAARAAGFGEVAEAEGDASSLARMIIAKGVRGPVLHVRGTVVAGDVAAELRAAGIETRQALVYRQEAAAPTAQALGLLAGDAPVIVPLFSPRSAALWFEGQAARPPRAPLVILALSAAVARAVPEGAGGVMIADKPDVRAMLELLPDALAAAKRLEGANGAQ